MCGIAGYINLNGMSAHADYVKRMTDVISHRGPDGEGQWVEDNIGLGHRRLAIIDLSADGYQPMVSAERRWVLTYNGEIYNYRELRAELEAEGYWFRSNTDTEVVLNALVHWGEKALQKFNGMFALALWDRKEKKLLIARDRYGIKPLYYSQQGDRFSFASEHKAITIQNGFNSSLNHAALYEYLTFQNIFTDQTLLKDIHLLPAGHFGTVSIDQPKLSQERYWDYNFSEPDSPGDEREYREELDRLFKQAVNRQLVGDVELGSYLSGGMDSGSISAMAAKSFPNLKTFTCGFDLSSASGIELAFDERKKAEAMSALFKTEHYEIVLKAGDMERSLPDIAWHLEEPRVGQSYPNYYAAKLASKFVKVVLSGTGGDEMFGGYPWRYYRGAGSADFDNYIDEYYLYWQRLVDNSQLKKMFSPSIKEVEGIWTRDIFRNVFPNEIDTINTPEEYINKSLYFEAKTFLHGLFLVEDKLSMAHGLESRVPFMDNDLVDFAMRCPLALKLNNLAEVVRINENKVGDKKELYFKKTNDGKQLLRDMMSNYIPKSITGAAKQGFSSPDASWFKGESIDFVRRQLFASNAEIYHVLDKDVVTGLINDHLEGRKNNRLLIWSLINLEEWFKTYL